MNKLTAEKCRSHIARLKRYEEESLYQFPFEMEMLEAFEIALPILEQQERGEGGWIEWGGGECPVGDSERVELKWSTGKTSKGRAGNFDWINRTAQGYCSIIAYRTIPERAANQNGEH